MLKEAVAEFEQASSLAGGSSMFAASLAHALGLGGRGAEALKVIGDLKSMSERGFVSRYDLAIANLGLGDKDKTFQLLSAAVLALCTGVGDIYRHGVGVTGPVGSAMAQ